MVPKVDSDALSANDREAAVRMSSAIAARMSPPGALGLPRLLDERRILYGITDNAFKRVASFDRVLVWQIPMHQGETFEEGGKIIMSDTSKARERATAPFGIIVSAGLQALDQLVSNGIDLGHRILFCHSAPYFVRYDTVSGKHHTLVVLHAGDIIGSEDLATNLRKRTVRIIQNKNNTESVEHILITPDGKSVLPQPATNYEDS